MIDWIVELLFGVLVVTFLALSFGVTIGALTHNVPIALFGGQVGMLVGFAALREV